MANKNKKFKLSSDGESILCSECDKFSPATSTFCCHCGVPLSACDLPDEEDLSNLFDSDIINTNEYNFSVNEAKELPNIDIPDGNLTEEQEILTDANSIMMTFTPVNDVSDKMLCPNCSNPIMPYSIYCSYCAADVSLDTANKLIERKICSNCDNINPLQNEYCNYCFGTLEESPVVLLKLQCISNADSNDLLKQMVYVDISMPGKIYKECSQCFSLNDTARDICYYCGTTFNNSYKKILCQHCGTNNSINANNCCKCNKLLNKDNKIWECDCGNINESDANFCSMCGNAKGER